MIKQLRAQFLKKFFFFFLNIMLLCGSFDVIKLFKNNLKRFSQKKLDLISRKTKVLQDGGADFFCLETSRMTVSGNSFGLPGLGKLILKCIRKSAIITEKEIAYSIHFQIYKKQ